MTAIHESSALTNPRATFDQAALEELAASIRLRGVLQPIVVRARVEDGGYELIAGARRLRTARLADLATIPAHVVTLDDQAARETAIVSLVRDYQQAIVTSAADPIASGGTSGDTPHSMLVAPFSKLLRPGAPVVIVPDAALSQLNFETPPVDGPRRHYWIEDVQMAVASSLGILAAARASRAAARRPPLPALVIGDQFPHTWPYVVMSVNSVATES